MKRYLIPIQGTLNKLSYLVKYIALRDLRAKNIVKRKCILLTCIYIEIYDGDNNGSVKI